MILPRTIVGRPTPKGPDTSGGSVKLPRRGPTGYTRSDKKRSAGVKSGLTRQGRARSPVIPRGPKPATTKAAGPAGPLGRGGGAFRSPSVQLPKRQRFGGTGGGFLSKFFRQFSGR